MRRPLPAASLTVCAKLREAEIVAVHERDASGGERMDPKKTDARFELAFSPNMRLIAVVRRFVSEFYNQVLSDPETTSRLTLASHELLENAVKYSFDGNTCIQI